MDLSHVDAQMHAHTRACVDKHTHTKSGVHGGHRLGFGNN